MHRPYENEPHPLVRKLASALDLSAAEEAAVRALPMMVREIARKQDVVRDGDQPSQCCVVIEGFLFRYKVTANAKRQILAYHISGEIPDAQSLYLKTMDHSLAALTRAKVGFIQHAAVFDLIARFPRIGGALWRETLIDAAIFREWVVNLGVRAAPQRLAHLMAEIYLRLDSIGLAEDGTVSFPATQEELGDTLGISSVHTNRALQHLRTQGLLSVEGGRLTIPDWRALAQYCDFDPTYLHMRSGTP